MPTRTLFLGPIVHSLSLTELEFLSSALLCVGQGGMIEWVEKDVVPSLLQEKAGEHGVLLGGVDVEVVELGEGEFLCPGMVDTHTVRLHQPPNPLSLLLLTVPSPLPRETATDKLG